MAVSLNKLAQTVDLYFETRQKRLDMQKEVDAVQAEERKLKEFLINNISKTEHATGVAGKLMCATIVQNIEPAPEDWNDIYKFLAKSYKGPTANNFDLLQKRLSPPAVRERWEGNVDLPGIGRVQVTELSLTKL